MNRHIVGNSGSPRRTGHSACCGLATICCQPFSPVDVMHSAGELGKGLKAGNRPENLKQNVADEIHSEKDERESNCYHGDPHWETSRQNLTNLAEQPKQEERTRP